MHIFRKKNLKAISFTWSSKDFSQASRLDRFYISFSVLQSFRGNKCFPCPLSDHDFADLFISSVNVSLHGSGVWKFNCSLLSDDDFVNDVRLFNRRTSAGELCRSNQLFTAHLLGGDKFSYQLNSCTSTRFRFNKELNYKLAALEVFLPNRNAFASVVASLKIYCTSIRVILRTSCWGIFHCIFCLLVFIKHEGPVI